MAVLKYLCLLDNVGLRDKSVELGSFKLCRHTRQELAEFLRGRDDGPLEEDEREQLEEWSALTWAHYEQQAADCQILRDHGCNSSDLELNRRIFARATTISRENRLEPFRRLIEALNLLKPSDGPVRVCRIFLRPVKDIQTGEQVVSRYVNPYSARRDPVDGIVRQNLQGYSLGKADQAHFSQFQSQLGTKGTADGTYLLVARHFFERADEHLVLGAENFDLTDPLLAYEATLEALLIGENEGGVEKSLSRRFQNLMERCCEEWLRRSKRGDIPTPESFARRVFTLRSKTVHGVWPIRKITDYMTRKSSDCIPHRRGTSQAIPAGDYGEVFPALVSCPPKGFSTDFNLSFLVNLREAARRCLRYFLKKQDEGSTRAQIIQGLDTGAKP